MVSCIMGVVLTGPSRSGAGGVGRTPAPLRICEQIADTSSLLSTPSEGSIAFVDALASRPPLVTARGSRYAVVPILFYYAHWSV